jgi:ribulose-5-phosphate 4-epimerase/fuculose-1-phosphate aldolase
MQESKERIIPAAAAPRPLTTQRVSVYLPEQSGLTFPVEPVFANFEEERLQRKKSLVAACRAFSAHGYDYGFAGHLTVRDPERTELYWTNPMAVHFSQVNLSNLILVNHDGIVVEGTYALNRAGFVLHAAVHEAHPDIIAMCHAHTIYGTAFSALGRELDPISQDSACFFEDHVVIRAEAGSVAVKRKAGHTVAAAFQGVKAAIHQNHGIFTASRHSIESAAFWFITMERCCQQQLIAESTGVKPLQMPPENSRHSREHVGSEYIGWLHFQPIYEKLLKDNPDMFA